MKEYKRYTKKDWQKDKPNALYNAGYRKEKTCKNVTENHPVDEFICSKCGLILQDYCKKRLDDDGDEYFFEFEIKYCPNCGAKVVDE